MPGVGLTLSSWSAEEYTQEVLLSLLLSLTEELTLLDHLESLPMIDMPQDPLMLTELVLQ